jgi:repressor LexA
MLTKTQHKILGFLRRFATEHDYAPTCAEIAAELGMRSRGVVYRHLQAIARAKYIKMTPSKWRNIELTNLELGYLPLLGKIAAGSPIEAIPDSKTLNLKDKLFGEDNFLLRVSGESMIEENICDGDLIICRQSKTACNNDIVVTLIDQQEVTLKRIAYNKNSTITLIPANTALKSQTYASKRIQVQGVFIGLLRLQ